MAGETIVIAEDNTHIRMLVRSTLAQSGYRLIEATDGDQALRVTIDERPDLLLLDVTMPELDGLEVLSFLSKRPEASDTKVIMLTTATDGHHRESCRDFGVAGYVVKPFEPSELRRAVTSALASGAA